MAQLGEEKGSPPSARLLFKNAMWNFAGLAAPLIVGIFAIPILIEGLGKERFGLLTIIWMGVSYFSLFDLGFGRALTKLVAERIDQPAEELRPVIWTALFSVAALGAVAAVMVWLGATVLVRSVLNVDFALQGDGVAAFQLLALGLPLVTLTSALVGLLEAHQRFFAISAIRVPLGVLGFAGPVVTLQWSQSLVWATGSLLLARILAMVAFWYVAKRVQPELRNPRWPDRTHLRSLWSLGGWMTVSNTVGPLMVYFDRFMIGTLLNMKAVAYYATPWEVLSRLQLVPQAIVGVLFPAWAAAYRSDRSRLVALYGGAVNALTVLMMPVAGAAFLFAPEALELWLGSEFRRAATGVVQWLAVGWLLNALARPALTVLQSIGRPDLPAKIHLGEVVPYFAALWLVTEAVGIVGTAAVWTLRAAADAVILNVFAARAIPELRVQVLRAHIVAAGVLLGAALLWLLEPLALRSSAFVALCFFTAVLGVPMLRRLKQGTSGVANLAHNVSRSVRRIG